MMKCVLALVVVLHLCNSVKSNIALNGEIISGLNKLQEHYKSYKINTASAETALLRVPSTHMIENASSCVGVFIRKLEDLLNNLPQQKNTENILRELRANLTAMGTHQENNSRCTMTSRRGSRLTFKQYVAFLKTLNSLEGR